MHGILLLSQAIDSFVETISMATANLTLTSVRQLPYSPSGTASSWCVYWDRKLHGLGLRVTDSDARSYVIRYRVRGSRTQRIKTIGAITVLTVRQARDRAKEIIRSAELGEDWFESVARDRSKTMQDLWKYYEAHHLTDPGVSAGFRHQAPLMWKAYCAGRFTRRPVVAVTPEQARDWHRHVTRRGAYIANRAAQLLRAVWNYGSKFGQVPRGVPNPFAAVTLNREQPRKIILQPEDLPRLAKAIDSIENSWAKAYFWMLFYTGARRTEMLTLRWTDVDLKARMITFRQTKAGEPHQMHLSPPAFQILKMLPRSGNPFVFAGDRDERPLHPDKLWEGIRAASGLADLRMHDLRRSFGSWLGARGYTSKQIGTLLGHKTDITSRVYIQLGEAVDLKRELTGAFAKLAKNYRAVRPRKRKISQPTTILQRLSARRRRSRREIRQPESPQIPHRGGEAAPASP